METNEMMKSMSEKQVENQMAGNGFFADDTPIQVSVKQGIQYEDHIEAGFVY